MTNTTSSTADLVTIGESMGSLSSTEHGPLGHTRTLRLRTAGAEANVAIGIQRLGLQSLWAGRVGDDPIGDLVVRELLAEGVHVRASRDDAPTALMIKERRTSEVTQVHYWRQDSAGSRTSEKDVPEAEIRNARVLHLTGVTAALGHGPRRALWKAIEIARGERVPVSFDVNFRSRLWSASEAGPVLRDVIKHVDILFAGNDEASLLTSHRDGAALRDLSRLGPSSVLLKKGAHGSSALIGHTIFDHPGYTAISIDAVGAGDAYAAGYLAGMLLDWAPEQRLKTASRLGAIAISTDGDWEGLPRLAELTRFSDPEPVQR